MRFSWIAMAALLAFSGCSQKGAFDLFKMDASHERAVEQLRTGAIVLSLETKAILSTLYLNPIYPDQYKDGEYFIAAVYFERDNRDIRKWDLNTYGYTLTLNGKKATILEELDQSDPRRTLIPVQNNWNKYFFIRFDSVADSSLALQLENNRTGKVVLKYQK
ncbi:hypothetical protein [Sulfuricurvum sp. RIFCSPLOWO2_12_FULL_43_24]|uniref:hypothetical protein n=1 Tax=Sulfuricurvum sp. RIFCSPLOWO2_12_FULL_43_24 TaxID=1802247 RepID=UPI0025D0C547|nr:hypothetical protein [Sulfuricurvum sp. RIFCSPLOWO2_12_FULL_43_24]